MIKVTKRINGELITEELGSNLVMDGEVIVDILTTSPSLSSIPSASAILDTSNYTIQAATFGKAASQYTKHAHSSDVSALVIADGMVRVYVPSSQESVNVSSYQTSAAPTPGLPEFASPMNTRLESEDTSTDFSDVNIGHHLNMILTSGTNGLGASAALVGCFPTSAAGGTPAAIVSSLVGGATVVASGVMRSPINVAGVMDPSGFMNMVVSSITNTAGLGTMGQWMTGDLTFSSLGPIKYILSLSGGDATMPLLFGGIYSIGLWCLDVKAMLNEGITPPFSFDAVNNNRKYRLFAKKVFTKDLLWGIDNSANSTFGQGIYPRAVTDSDYNEIYIEWRVWF